MVRSLCDPVLCSFPVHPPDLLRLRPVRHDLTWFPRGASANNIYPVPQNSKYSAPGVFRSFGISHAAHAVANPAGFPQRAVICLADRCRIMPRIEVKTRFFQTFSRKSLIFSWKMTFFRLT